MSDQAIWAFAKHLSIATNVAQLIIFNCGLTDTGALAIGEVLKKNAVITVLDLSRVT